MQVTAPTPAVDTEDQRTTLPKNVKPIHYDLKLYPDLDTFTYGGKVAIQLDVLEDTNTITLHSLNIRFLSVCLEWGKQAVWTDDIEYATEDERVILHFNSTVPANTVAVLSISFCAIISSGMEGFYRSSYVDADGKTKYLGTTQFEPTSARRAFPCWDEPALKATFSISITAKENFVILSNMNAAKESLDNGYKTVDFAKTVTMSTYLLAWVVGELEYVEAFTSGEHCAKLPVRVYTTPGSAHLGKFAADLGAKTLDFFSGVFNEPYPLPKCDMVAIPDFEAGAMENWGLVTYRLSAVIVDENSAAATIERVAEVVQHELAHQWFGNLVTMQFWDSLWLNEGFATWMSWFSCNHFYPEWKVWEGYVIDNLQSALSLDSLRSSHPIEMPILHEYEINQMFDAISYSKGSCVIRMISKYLSEDVFIKGIQRYISKHRYGNAVTENLWDALSEVSGIDVNGIMNCWVKKIGFPVVSVTETEKGLKVEQHRFLSSGDVKEEEDKTLYWLPLKLKTLKDGKAVVDEKLVSTERSALIPADKDALVSYKLNADQTAIYRVAYTSAHLERLSKLAVAQPDYLTVEDRAGLVADVAAISRAGYGHVSDLFNIVRHWKHDSSFVVFSIMLQRINGINNTMNFQSKELTTALRKFLLDISAPKCHELGWKFDDKDDHISRQFKALLFSVAGLNGDEKVIAAARAMFDAYVQGDSSAINDNLRSAVFQIVITHGGKKQWEQLLNIYKTSRNPYEKIYALRSFGRTQDDELLQRTLRLVLDPIVKDQDIYIVYGSCRNSAKGIRAMWDFNTTHWPEICKRLPAAGTMQGTVVNLMCSSFTSEEDIKKIEAFFADKDTRKYERPLRQAIDVVRSSASFIAKSSGDIVDWLKKTGYYV
ncbi:aminopeptidase Ape2 [Schizosaccharomyces japonicus yFS275]|uniref:Aminopeptidase n=1 Tax=Schizosaccharomyces japonicus (strain yFS275 / FY16936) TaxID=402676 RepID=B6JXP0_SCHJY|nr:aminopeptidase Ape2 [Schizosaccharomyces japonicus yFS275]EEB05184.1 aminopeptidase Ape2 [Schizosaccharomyces japonicus yFS275]